ncbi:protein phosphatase 1H, partial [Trichonephila clavata]
MFNRVKNALYNVVGGLDTYPAIKDGEYSDRPPLKFRYTRPTFLQLTSDDEVQVSADHVIRPIIVPRDITKLPWELRKWYRSSNRDRTNSFDVPDADNSPNLANTNVAEDPKFTTPPSTPEPLRKTVLDHTIPWIYFALFDGHAGSGVAVAASNTLHKIVQ